MLLNSVKVFVGGYAPGVIVTQDRRGLQVGGCTSSNRRNGLYMERVTLANMRSYGRRAILVFCDNVSGTATVVRRPQVGRHRISDLERCLCAHTAGRSVARLGLIGVRGLLSRAWMNKRMVILLHNLSRGWLRRTK